jgi:hypothetical protein
MYQIFKRVTFGYIHHLFQQLALAPSESFCCWHMLYLINLRELAVQTLFFVNTLSFFSFSLKTWHYYIFSLTDMPWFFLCGFIVQEAFGFFIMPFCLVKTCFKHFTIPLLPHKRFFS